VIDEHQSVKPIFSLGQNSVAIFKNKHTIAAFGDGPVAIILGLGYAKAQHTDFFRTYDPNQVDSTQFRCFSLNLRTRNLVSYLNLCKVIAQKKCTNCRLR
jgi:hypothetical protein